MKLALADVDVDGLRQTATEVSSVVGASNVLALPVDVANLDEVVKFKEKVFETWDEVKLCFNLLWKRSCTDVSTITGCGLDEQCWYSLMERQERNVLGEQGCLDQGLQHKRCGVHVSLFLHKQLDLIENLFLVIQGPERSAHVRAGKTMKRSHSVTILPGAESLSLNSMGGGPCICRPNR